MKYSVTISLLLCIGFSMPLLAQVGIGTINPDPSAELHVSSTEGGFLAPVMTKTQRDAINSPALGLLLFCTDCDSVGYYVSDGENWNTLNTNGLIVDSLYNIYTNTHNLSELDSGFSNIILGDSALYSLRKGGHNLAIGSKALQDLDSGSYNIGLGKDALRNLTKGSENMAIGYNAMENITSDDDNIAIGSRSMQSTSSGSENVAVGPNTLSSLDTGNRNVAIGYQALDDLDKGHENVAIGPEALENMNYGYGNNAIGADALGDLESGNDNIALGDEALEFLENGDHNIGIGAEALNNSSSIYGNVAIGDRSGYSTQGDSNVYIGNYSGYNATGSNKLYIENSPSSTPLIGGDFSGDRVGINVDMSTITTGGATLQVGGDLSLLNGVAVNEFSTDGTLAGNSDDALPTEKAVKTYVDSSAQLTGTAYGNYNYHTNQGNMVNMVGGGHYNYGIGRYSLYSVTTGDRNIGIGQATLYETNTSNDNIAIGHNALKVNTGSSNAAIGSYALYDNTTGAQNLAIGKQALYNSISGNDNIALGYDALRANLTSSGSVAIGTDAGRGATGSGHVFLGYQAGYSEMGNDMLYIENSSSSSPLIGGSFSGNKVGINTAAATLVAGGATLQVGGDISVENGTDINEFSTDGTLTGNSDDALPTEKAIKTYVDDNASKLVKTTLGIDNYHTNLSNMTSVTSSGDYNMASGYEALNNLTTGDYNYANGMYSLKNNTTGGHNIAIGYSTLFSNVYGGYNVAIGKEAGLNITGSYNTIIGHESGENTTGSFNTFLGRRSGYDSQSNYSVFLGYYAGYHEGNDKRLYIENTSTDTPLIGGDFENNKVGVNMKVDDLANTTAALQVGGAASKSSSGSWIANSDRRLKTNIEYMQAEEVLHKILQLKGASYEWNDTVTAYANTRPEGIQYGFIAQDIEKVWPSKIAKDGQGYLMTAYGDYDPMFVESIRALNNKIEDLTKQLNAERMSFEEETKQLKAQLENQQKEMQSQLDEIKALLKKDSASMRASTK